MLLVVSGVCPAWGRGAIYPSSCAPWVSGVLVLGALLAGLLLPPLGGFLLLSQPLSLHELQDLMLSVGSLLPHPSRRGYVP